MQRPWAEVTRLIDVGSLAGTGKAGGVAAHVGAQGVVPVDEGAFRESLKASVGAATMARTVVPGVPAIVGANPTSNLPAMVTVSATAPTAEIESAGHSVVATPLPTFLGNSISKELVVDVSAPAAPVSSGDVAGPVAVAVSARPTSSAVLEVAPGAKVVENAPVVALAGLKDVKEGARTVGEGLVGKKIVGKSPEKGGAPPAVAIAAVDGTVAATAPVVPIQVQVQVAGLPATAAAAPGNEGKAQAAAMEASGKIAKAGASKVAVKAVGRDAKKVDGPAAVAAKGEVVSAVRVASPVAGSGGGHVPGKDALGVVTAQGVAGAGAVAAAGVVASHAGVVGVAGAKVAANVDGVSTPAGQGSRQGSEVKTLAATPNLLEVGIDGGTHGWLRVRAELGQTGEVTASMVASSAGQADTLRRELPAMSTYLAGESVGVSSLVVNAAGGAAGAQDAAMSLGTGAQGSGGDGRAQGSGPNPQSDGPGSGLGASEGGAIGLEFGAGELPAAVYANGSGSWLSVRV